MSVFRSLAYLFDVITSIIMVVLGVRLVFRMFNANTVAPIVRSVYFVTEPLLVPLRNVFPAQELAPGFVIEFVTLFAIVSYALVGYILVRLFDALADSTLRHKPVARSI